MTLIDEMILAGRGILALLTGRRNASGYFDLTLRGLAGSFVAFLLATTLNAYLPVLLGQPSDVINPPQALFMALVLFGLQLTFSALVLNQLKRLDGLVPYMVADNWATFFVTMVTIILSLVGFTGDLSLIVVGLLVIIIEINIARLIVTLTPLQIAMFLIAQMVGVTIGLLLFGMLMPLPDVPV